ncbi:MAG: 5-(carboxyamino)imidazole ribonucleotide synthase [Alphaproteobacteria bacterium]|nr:5-(carboxyamino)imidazole ribonucleotide synthase [Alphaproteobacteria bacterium]
MVIAKTLGILGGGQLGRMSAMAAAQLGIKTHIFCPETGCPASLVTSYFTQAEYNDHKALKAFAQNVDVITYEFENIPLETIEFLEELKPVYPGRNLLEVSQNRLKEKSFLNDIGIKTAPWAPCHAPEDIAKTLKEWQADACIIKTARFGYDGKGQIFHKLKDNIYQSWEKLKTEEAVIEGIIDFDLEISVVIARDLMGQSSAYVAVQNEHKNHILDRTIAPAPVSNEVLSTASDMAHHLAEAIDLVGVLALELFVTKDGTLIANEIAPRPHNSGHWTIDACHTSQFENHVRAVCGLPVGSTVAHSDAEMINLIGDDVHDLGAYLEMEKAHIHLYGKAEVRPGRKMGHVTILK